MSDFRSVRANFLVLPRSTAQAWATTGHCDVCRQHRGDFASAPLVTRVGGGTSAVINEDPSSQTESTCP